MSLSDLIAKSCAARQRVDAALDLAEVCADDVVVSVVAAGARPTGDVRAELQSILDRSTGTRAAIVAGILAEDGGR